MAQKQGRREGAADETNDTHTHMAQPAWHMRAHTRAQTHSHETCIKHNNAKYIPPLTATDRALHEQALIDFDKDNSATPRLELTRTPNERGRAPCIAR